MSAVDLKGRVSPHQVFGVIDSALALAKVSARYLLLVRLLLSKLDSNLIAEKPFCLNPLPERHNLVRVKYLLTLRRLNETVDLLKSLPPSQVTPHLLTTVISRLTSMRESLLRSKDVIRADRKAKVEFLEKLWREGHWSAWGNRDSGLYAAFILCYRSLRDYSKMAELFDGNIVI